MGELFKPLTPREIYDKLKGGDGTPLLDEAHAASMAECVAEHARALMIRKQADLVQSGWEGTAGDAALGPVRPLADNALNGGEQLRMAQDLMSRQSGAFHSAANSVRPVPPEPPLPDLSDPMWPFVDYEKQITDYQADAQHNIQVFRGYDLASESHEEGMRVYATVDDSGGIITVAGNTGNRIEVPDGEPRGGEESGPVGGRLDPGSAPVDGPAVNGPAVTGPAPGGQQTSPSDFVPPSVSTPLPGVLSPGQPTPTGPTPGGLVAGLPVGGFTAGGPGSTGGPGARAGGSGGPVAGGPGSTGRGPGMRGGLLGAGPGLGALAAEEAAAQRAAAAAAARGTGSGVMGGAPVGAGRGKGDEDDEHQRKVLIEIDAEGLFGSDVLTAPQVIGDDAYEDD